MRNIVPSANAERPSTTEKKKFLKPFAGEPVATPPIWLMRQAGRYLPEYREVRKEAGSFLDLCYTPKFATEVTLQPIRRYGFDAAILFSDILVVPDALGQNVRFVEGEGPRLDPITEVDGLKQLDLSGAEKKYSIVCETVARLSQDLPPETTLIGFCGAPWTVATYMVGGRGSPDQAAARSFAYKDPQGFQKLMDILVESSVEYLLGQVKAGAEVLQIFDSWAGSLPDNEFQKWVVAPTARLVSRVREQAPNIPIIGFPRGAEALSCDYVRDTDVNGISCDTSTCLTFMRERLSKSGAVLQGNLDPLLLVAGGPALKDRTLEIIAAMKGQKFIFNLGHGIVPQTPPEHVAQLVETVRASS